MALCNFTTPTHSCSDLYFLRKKKKETQSKFNQTELFGNFRKKKRLCLLLCSSKFISYIYRIERLICKRKVVNSLFFYNLSFRTISLVSFMKIFSRLTLNFIVSENVTSFGWIYLFFISIFYVLCKTYNVC